MADEREWKYGDRVLVSIVVQGALKGQTNERSPTGNWWVEIDGRLGLTAFNECDLRMAPR